MALQLVTGLAHPICQTVNAKCLCLRAGMWVSTTEKGFRYSQAVSKGFWVWSHCSSADVVIHAYHGDSTPHTCYPPVQQVEDLNGRTTADNLLFISIQPKHVCRPQSNHLSKECTHQCRSVVALLKAPHPSPYTQPPVADPENTLNSYCKECRCPAEAVPLHWWRERRQAEDCNDCTRAGIG